MQNLLDYKWTKVEATKSELESIIKQIESWKIEMPVSDVCKINLHCYKLALLETVNFGLNDTVEFEIATRRP